MPQTNSFKCLGKTWKSVTVAIIDALGRDSRLIIIELYIISHMICYLAIFKLLNKSFLSHTAIQILKFLWFIHYHNKKRKKTTCHWTEFFVLKIEIFLSGLIYALHCCCFLRLLMIVITTGGIWARFKQIHCLLPIFCNKVASRSCACRLRLIPFHRD